MGQGKKWTQEELEYLENSWGEVSINKISKKLKRPIQGIRLKACRIGLGDFLYNGTYILLFELLRALGLDNSATHYINVFVKNNMPIKYKKSATGKKSYRVVYLDEFWKWAEKNKGILNFARFERGNLGEEPEWVDEKRKADKYDPNKKNHNRIWTKAEDEKLLFMVRSQRYTYADIAQELKRTEKTLRFRLIALGEKKRPIGRKTNQKWDEEDISTMIDLHKKGYSDYAIAVEMNKPHMSITTRLREVLADGTIKNGKENIKIS